MGFSFALGVIVAALAATIIADIGFKIAVSRKQAELTDAIVEVQKANLKAHEFYSTYKFVKRCWEGIRR